MKRNLSWTLFFLGLLPFYCFANTYCQYNSNPQITQSNGVVEEPIGGGNYEDEKVCSWTLRKPQDTTASHVTFKFSRFDLEYAYDYLFITVGTFTNKWHGYEAPSDFSVPLNGTSTVVVKFVTDQLVSFTGFKLNYEFAYCSSGCVNGVCSAGVCTCNIGFTGPSCAQTTCSNNCYGNGVCVNNQCVCNEGFTGSACERPPVQHCSGDITVSGASGNFSDHYPYYEPYKGNSRCGWIINTGSAGPVTVATSLHQFNWGDALYLYNNFGNSSSLLGSLAYSGFPMEPLIGDSGQMYLRFVATDTDQQYTGFTALYSRNDQCPNSCSGKGYCIQGSCYCYATYAGADCSRTAVATPIIPGVVTKDTVNDYSWKYYQLDIPVCNAGESFTVKNLRVHNETPVNTFSSQWKWGGGYLEYYLQRGKLPTPQDYLLSSVYYWYPDFTFTPNVCPATYYIGVHADEAAVFSISVPTFANIPTTATTATTYPSADSSSHTPAKHLGTGLIAAIIIVVISVIGFGALAGLYVYYTKFRKTNNHVFEPLPLEDPDDSHE